MFMSQWHLAKNIVHNDCLIPVLLGINSHKVSEMGV